jgi:Family of unknown function (DUF6049)
VAALLLALPVLGGPTRASAVPTATTGVLGPVRVAVSSISPPSPGPGDTFAVVGRAVNAGTLPISDVGVRLRVDTRRLTSRDALAEAAAVDADGNPVAADPGTFFPASSILTGLADSLAPGGSIPFRISMPAEDLGFAGFGVHTVTIEVRGVGQDGRRVTVGSTRTFIVWRSVGTLPTVRVSWLVPLQDLPLRGVDGRVDATAADALADSLDPGGRLSSLVSAGAGEPITWAVDPDLLEEVVGLAGGLPLEGGGTTTPDAGAQAWLTLLKASPDVSALPYADPDLTASRRASLSADLPAEVAEGTATATRILGRTVPAAPAWPVDGVATPGTLGGAQSAGLTQVVLSSTTLRLPDVETATPDALGALSNSQLQVIAADSTLSTLAATDPRRLGNNTLARLRLLAETAMVAAERPSDPRSVVIAVPRDWAPSPGWAKVLLTLNRVAPWIVPVHLSALTADPGDAPVRRLVPYPATAAAVEVPASQLRVVRQTSGGLQRFAEILTDPGAYVPAYTTALQRGQSAAWRTDPTGGQAYVRSVANALAGEQRKVRILGRGQVTLSSRSGKIPLTVRNGLAQDIRIGVQLTATPAFRLRMGKDTVSTVEAGRTASVEVPASTSADGRIPVRARLSTPLGEPLGPTVTFDVRATGYGKVARLVAGALVVLLGLSLVVRVFRRIRGGASAADAAARDIMAEEAGQQ